MIIVSGGLPAGFAPCHAPWAPYVADGDLRPHDEPGDLGFDLTLANQQLLESSDSRILGFLLHASLAYPS